MSDAFLPFDVVRIPAGLPQHGVPAGARAVVLEVHEYPYLAYEIEVVDEAGRTVFSGAVEPAWIEPDHPDEVGDE